MTTAHALATPTPDNGGPAPPHRARRPVTAAALRSASGACIAPRVFYDLRQNLGTSRIKPIDLESIRDDLAKQVRNQDPRDIERTPSQLHLEWSADLNRATLRILGGPPPWMRDDDALDGLDALGAGAGRERLIFTKQGLRGYVREVFGGHAMPLLDRLVAASADGGAKVATMAGALLARPLDKRPLQLRTVRTRDEASGGIVRAVRGVFRSYTPYDDLEYLNDLLDCQATRDLPVLAYRRGDDGMRVRFALARVEDPRQPIPIVDGWSSETGGGKPASTVLQGGSWKLICLNGMMAVVPGAIWRWAHTGNRERVRGGVPQAVAEIRAKADGLVEAYAEAVDVAIDDAFGWLQAQLAMERVNADTIDAIGRAINHETATPDRMLASTIDAVTWVAQQESDMYRQRDLETIAAHVMARGLDEAHRAPDGRLRAPTPIAA